MAESKNGKSKKSKEDIREQLKEYKLAYKNGRISKELSKKNLNRLIRKIEYLGNSIPDKLFLATVLADLERYKDAEDILSEYENETLDLYERSLYKNTKQNVIYKRNVSFISSLYYSGKSFEEIMNIAERENSEYRIGLTIPFIRNVINQCKNKKQMMSEDKEH